MDAIRQILGVAAVFGLLGAALWISWRRPSWKIGFTARGRTRSMEVIDRLALTSHHSLHLVKVNGHEVMIATYRHGCAIVRPGATPEERSE